MTERPDKLEIQTYDILIKSAFQSAFDPIRNVIQPGISQLVIWYYMLASGGLTIGATGARYPGPRAPEGPNLKRRREKTDHKSKKTI